MLEAAILVVFPVLVAFAAASDLLTMTIPNRVSLMLASAFVVMAMATGMPFGQFSLHLVAGALVLVISFGLFAAGWMGGGDAKVASAIALWFGLSDHLTGFLILTAFYGMLLTIALVSARQMPYLPGVLRRQEWALRLHDSRSGIPYGIAIAVAALQVYPQSSWFNWIPAA
ncbi:A24 family peptidase [Pannonibacter carbonis]|uniref:A24 family peptidase n=1 Tax=Pannonibacter carbonis TaxID=2067569 RepID=UPI000D0EE0CC|nr:prepilin peptidase [Pannonibacter carbonis]